MKFGFRRPSLKKRIAARTSLKRLARNSLGLRVPKGWGWLTNPRKALYNRVYRRTTFGVEDLFRTGKKSQTGCLMVLLACGGGFGFLMLVMFVRTCSPAFDS